MKDWRNYIDEKVIAILDGEQIVATLYDANDTIAWVETSEDIFEISVKDVLAVVRV